MIIKENIQNNQCGKKTARYMIDNFHVWGKRRRSKKRAWKLYILSANRRIENAN